MGKEKAGFLTPKAISNRIKAKGLQKLRWYCQMCQKQCRDEVCCLPFLVIYLQLDVPLHSFPANRVGFRNTEQLKMKISQSRLINNSLQKAFHLYLMYF